MSAGTNKLCPSHFYHLKQNYCCIFACPNQFLKPQNNLLFGLTNLLLAKFCSKLKQNCSCRKINVCPKKPKIVVLLICIIYFKRAKTIKMSTRRLFTEVAILACFLLPLVFPNQCPLINTAQGFRAVCPTHHLFALCVFDCLPSSVFSIPNESCAMTPGISIKWWATWK